MIECTIKTHFDFFHQGEEFIFIKIQSYDNVLDLTRLVLRKRPWDHLSSGPRYVYARVTLGGRVHF